MNHEPSTISSRALIVWGGWDGHTPKESVDVFIPLLKARGFDLEIHNSLDVYADVQRMGGFRLVVQCWTMGQITPEQRKGLISAVRNGAGLAGWHGGIIDSFRQDTEYQWMTGGQWVAHPGGCIPSYEVEVTDLAHPIAGGIRGFALNKTEQYYVHVDPGVHVLCTSRFNGEHGDRDLYPAGVVMPYAWTRGWGRGRVFVAGWGHTFRDFEVPEAREMVFRGLLWAAREL